MWPDIFHERGSRLYRHVRSCGFKRRRDDGVHQPVPAEGHGVGRRESGLSAYGFVVHRGPGLATSTLLTLLVLPALVLNWEQRGKEQ